MGGSANRRLFNVYGLTIESDVAFSEPLPAAGGGPVDLVYSCTSQAPLAVDWANAELIYRTRYYLPGGTPLCATYRIAADCTVMCFGNSAHFYIWEQQQQIVCHLLDARQSEAAVHSFLGQVLANWLEQRGSAALHATAVVTEGCAVAFLADSGTGKSSLAACLVQHGARLLSDDLLAIRYHDAAAYASPGYPQLRLWDEQAAHFSGNAAAFSIANDGVGKRRVPVEHWQHSGFCAEPLPLYVAYVLERRPADDPAGQITIQTLAPAAAMGQLIHHSLARQTNNTRQRQLERFAFLSPLLTRVLVRRLVYPSGYSRLDLVRESVLADIEFTRANARRG